MKNVLIFLLVVAIVVLGILLFRARTKNAVGGGRGGKPVLEAAGTPHDDRKDYKGNPVKTKDCDYLAGETNNVCVVPVSYLDAMSGGHDDRALEVHPGDTIVWVGDTGEAINVQPVAQMDCVSGAQDPAVTLTDGPFPATSGQLGNVQFGHVLVDIDPQNATHRHRCFKTTIIASDAQGGHKRTVDPHMFDQ